MKIFAPSYTRLSCPATSLHGDVFHCGLRRRTFATVALACVAAALVAASPFSAAAQQNGVQHRGAQQNGPPEVAPQAPTAVDLRPFSDSFVANSSYGGATQDLAADLKVILAKRKVLLIWALDQSASMADDRNELLTHIDRMYQDLGSATMGDPTALRSAVISYGKSTKNHTPQPTNKQEAVMSAVRAVPTDPTGTEMQCQAIRFGATTFKQIAAGEDRQMVLVLVTDESGDRASNVAMLESTIDAAKQAKCRVHVFGRQATFGYPYAQLNWSHAETRTMHRVPIDRGPESAEPEALQFSGFGRRQDAFPSGFGPYDQMRIARETGGKFYLLPQPEVNLFGRDTRKYEEVAILPFAPELVSRDEYRARREQSPLRKMVAQVIADLDPARTGSKITGNEVGTGPLPIEPAAFAAAAGAEIKRADKLIDLLAAAQRELESAAPSRGEEKSLRWRANFDLLYAQTISYQVRLKEYRNYLDEFTRNPKTVKNIFGSTRKTNGWWVVTGKGLLKPDESAAARDTADGLFREVAQNDPGTPWAERAKDELNRGYGVQLVEGHDDKQAAAKITLPKF